MVDERKVREQIIWEFILIEISLIFLILSLMFDRFILFLGSLIVFGISVTACSLHCFEILAYKKIKEVEKWVKKLAG